jgi:23S rRNA (pseudouridine1915-N3)-methyltransferase
MTIGMKFVIVTIGKIKEDFILQGVREYCGRIDRYADLAFYPVKEERLVKGLPESLVLQKEAERLLAKVPRDGLWVALDRRGQEMNSRQHFDFLETQAREGVKKIYYLIGGPLGLSREVLKRSDRLLALSQMTLTHEMSALFLVEQIYRYLNFISGEKYHK